MGSLGGFPGFEGGSPESGGVGNFILGQKKGNSLQSDTPLPIVNFGRSGGPIGGPVLPILYQIPPAPTTIASGAAKRGIPLFVLWLPYWFKGVVIFSAAVILCKLVKVCLYMTWLVPSIITVATFGSGDNVAFMLRLCTEGLEAGGVMVIGND